MTKHTIGPWNVRNNTYRDHHANEMIGIEVGDSDGRHRIAEFCVDKGSISNALRAVECVNACEGIENPSYIKELIEHLKETAKYDAFFEIDAKELLKALGVKGFK